MSTSNRKPGTSPIIARHASAELTTAPAHGSRSAPGAARNHSTVRSHIPGPARGAGVEHQPGRGFGNAVGQPTGNGNVRASTSTSTSMCSKPSVTASSARSSTGRGA